MVWKARPPEARSWEEIDVPYTDSQRLVDEQPAQPVAGHREILADRPQHDRLPARGTVLQVSGRASFELVQKAVMAGIPVLSAVSAPSSLAADLAEQQGLTLAGFVRGESMVLYSRADRVSCNDAGSHEEFSIATNQKGTS